jgi:low affinity Fe/Cu permease
MRSSGERSAFYAVGRGTGGPGDWVTLLHPPYTLWHLSYVAIGAAVMPPLALWRLAGTLVAFFLAVGIGAHALDELHGRPLGTGISTTLLIVTAVAAITAAMVLGLVEGGWKLLPFVIAGGVLVYGYNLELFGGVLHSDAWFAVAWGAFPVLVGAYAQHWTLSVAAGVAAVAAFFLSLGQRALSTPARMLRRRVSAVAVRLTFPDGTTTELGRADLLAPIEKSLRYFVCATSAVAVAMVLAAR